MSRKGPDGLYKAPMMEESERLRGEGNKVKFIDIRLERGEAVGFRKGRRQDLP